MTDPSTYITMAIVPRVDKKELADPTVEHENLKSEPVNLEVDSTADEDKPKKQFDETRPAYLIFWMAMSVLCQLLYGFMPGFSRYLTVKHELDMFAIVAIGCGIASLCIGIPVLSRQGVRSVFIFPHWWVFMASTAPVHILVVAASTLTLSYYVQLIILTTPFFVAVIQRVVLKKAIPQYFFTAVGITTIGGFLAIFGDMLTTFRVDLSGSDGIGIVVAFGAVGAISVYLVVLAKVKHHTTSEGMLFIYTFVQFLIMMPISLGLNDWTKFATLPWDGWVVFAAMVFGLFIFATLLLMAVTRHLGAPLVGITLTARLVSALIFATSALGEEYSYINYIGAAIVFLTVLCYLAFQYKLAQRNAMKESEVTEIDVVMETTNKI